MSGKKPVSKGEDRPRATEEEITSWRWHIVPFTLALGATILFYLVIFLFAK